jgi:hypothetical protein
MEHRELYRGVIPEAEEGVRNYVITFSDLAKCASPTTAIKIARDIYYPIGGSYSSEAMDAGSKAHAIKEAEVGDWVNELRLSYKMATGFYLCGTIDRYYKVTKVIEDYKYTGMSADHYVKTKQVETYAFLAMNNDMTVHGGRYTTIDSTGHVMSQAPVEVGYPAIIDCYSTFIMPRFNMIKKEIERLEKQYVERTDRDTIDIHDK